MRVARGVRVINDRPALFIGGIGDRSYKVHIKSTSNQATAFVVVHRNRRFSDSRHLRNFRRSRSRKSARPTRQRRFYLIRPSGVFARIAVIRWISDLVIVRAIYIRIVI